MVIKKYVVFVATIINTEYLQQELREKVRFVVSTPSMFFEAQLNNCFILLKYRVYIQLPSFPQSNPLNSSGHSHLKHLTPSSEQFPPFLHGFLSHGRTGAKENLLLNFPRLQAVLHSAILMQLIS